MIISFLQRNSTNGCRQRISWYERSNKHQGRGIDERKEAHRQRDLRNGHVECNKKNVSKRKLSILVLINELAWC